MQPCCTDSSQPSLITAAICPRFLSCSKIRAVIRKLGVKRAASSAGRVDLGEGYKTQKGTVPLTFSCVVVVVLTTQILHTWGKLGRFVRGLSHWVCAQPVLGICFPIEMTQNEASKCDELTCCCLNPFDKVSGHVEGIESIHGCPVESLPMGCTARRGDPTFQRGANVVSAGKQGAEGSCRSTQTFFWLLPDQNHRQLSSVANVQSW